MESNGGSYHNCPMCNKEFTYTTKPAAEGEEEPAMEPEDGKAMSE